MILTRNKATFVIALHNALQRLTVRATIEEVLLDDSEASSEIKARIKAKLGPTHKVNFFFEGNVHTNNTDFGTVWKLIYDEDGITTSISNESKDEDWDRMKTDLGII